MPRIQAVEIMEVPSRFVSLAEFARRSSLSRGSIYNEIERGNLPPPIRLTVNRVAFPADVVEAWFAERMRSAQVAA